MLVIHFVWPGNPLATRSVLCYATELRTLERGSERLPGGRIPETHCIVHATGGKHTVIWRPRNRQDPASMTFEGVHLDGSQHSSRKNEQAVFRDVTLWDILISVKSSRTPLFLTYRRPSFAVPYPRSLISASSG
jgi:hypothetical protein